MSSETQPISSEQFAFAIQDLPIENIYSKAFEIHNSITHLENSNRQLQEYIDSIKSDTSLSEAIRQAGDKDCSEAIEENETVIQRQRERVDLLKAEVQRRGGRWHEADGEETVNGSQQAQPDGTASGQPSSTGGRLTDEELRRQMMDRMGDDDDDEDGMHL
jgi:hypothetical protein